MLVENLFFNTPARLKFLKPESTERRHILLMATRYAMAYPHVRFIVEQGGRETFRTPGTGQLADVLVTAFGLDVFRHMIEIEREQYQGITVSGFTTSPEYHRAERSRIHIFINGRWIQDTSITYAVTQAYHTFLDKGRYPAAVVMIELSPQDVDVNVHPTKAEVRFRDPNAVFAAVQRAVRRAILAQDSMPPQRLGEPPATLSMQFSTDQDWHSEPARISRHHTSLPSPVQPDGQQRPRTLPVLLISLRKALPVSISLTRMPHMPVFSMMRRKTPVKAKCWPPIQLTRRTPLICIRVSSNCLKISLMC